MNEWVMAAIIIGGTVLALGGGSFIMNAVRGNKKDKV
jgi:hypothetical protein